MAKQYTALRVDSQTHDNVVRFAEQLQAARGKQVTINDALTHLLEECYADVSGAFGAEIKIKKLGCGGHRRYCAN